MTIIKITDIKQFAIAAAQIVNCAKMSQIENFQRQEK